MAADYLRTDIGQNDQNIEWVAVRPDSLVDEEAVSKYEVYPSPIRSAIFNPGKTSRTPCNEILTTLGFCNSW